MMQTGKFDQDLEDQTNQRGNMLIRDILDPQKFLGEYQFQSLEYCYLLRESIVFDNILRQYFDQKLEIYDNQQQEEQKNPFMSMFGKKDKPLISRLNYEEFDKFLQDFIEDYFYQYVMTLAQYPIQDLSHSSLKVQWKDIEAKNVSKQIEIMQQFSMSQEDKEEKAELSQEDIIDKDLIPAQSQQMIQIKADSIVTKSPKLMHKNKKLINAMEIYCNLKDTIEKVRILSKMKLFMTAKKFEGSEELETLEDYQQFYDKINDQTMMKEIQEKSRDVLEILGSLQYKNQVKIDDLHELSRSQDLVFFCFENKDQNFTDLMERLDDPSILNASTLSEMNLMAQFFVKLQKHIDENEELSDFYDTMTYISLNLEQQGKDDIYFRVKLSNCINHVQQVKSINNQLNVTENTIQIVTECVTNGQVRWHWSPDGNDQIVLEIKYGNKILNNDQINQHCSRAMLLSHKRKEDQLQNLDQNMKIQVFTKVVDLSQEIRIILNDLYQNGHLDFQRDFKYSFEITMRPSQLEPLDQMMQQDIRKQTFEVIDNLKMHKNEILSISTEWKKDLYEIRSMYYFMTYINNISLGNLLNFMIKKEKDTLDDILSIFKYFNEDLTKDNLARLQVKKISGSTHKEQIMSASQIVNTFMKGHVKPCKELYIMKLRSHKKHIINPGEFRIYSVNSSLQLIHAIASIYCTTKFCPEISEIMFCTKRTKLYEIESFIMRAINAPQNFILSLRENMFVISNFQNLTLQVQIEAYSFLKKQQEADQSKLFQLIIMITKGENGNDLLIEEVRDACSFEKHLVEDKYVHEFFKDINATLVISSQSAGLGKSTQIKNKSDENIYQRIPIQGNLSKSSQIKLHQQKKIHNYKDLDLHYDIRPSFNEDLNVFMFELLYFKCINNGDSGIYHIPQDTQFFVELAFDITKDHEKNYFFKYIPQQEDLKWDLNRIQVSKDPQSPIQIVCRYINALPKEEQSFDIDGLMNPDVPLNDMACIAILEAFYLRDLYNPNFYFMNAFLAFSSDQITKLFRSPYFMSNEMVEYQFQEMRKGTGQRLYKQIIEVILDVSKKLSQQNLSHSEQNDALQDKSQDKKQMQKIQTNKWGNSLMDMTIINDEGEITPVYRQSSDAPEAIAFFIATLNQLSGGQLKEKLAFADMDQIELIDKIFKICGSSLEKYIYLSSQNSKENQVRTQFDINRIVFTQDNFLKLALIYMRIRAKQPVIIMGETGIGKTAIIQYLSDVLDRRFMTLNMHEGISEQDILDFVDKAHLALSEKSQNIILFFDEINTNVNVSGVLKEILIDRHCFGNSLDERISIVAACNPYVVKSSSMEDQAMTAGIKHSRMNQNASQLVYRVHPLPESVFSYIWDYGSLSKDEEFKYIEKIVETINQHSQTKITQSQIQTMVKTINFSQNFIKKSEAFWSVSLRDVSRFKKLYLYFEMNHSPENDLKEKFSTILVLTLAFCYIYRLSKRDKRKTYISEISKIMQSEKQGFFSEQQFGKILENEYKMYVDNIEIPPGIGVNMSLKENLFVIATCIRNMIPLFITGKPGSSKTLAMNLIIKSMKGLGSQNKFFQHLPSILTFPYQGSVQSTSIGVVRVFERGINCQEQNQADGKNNTIVLVLIDEIGLAEISPHNPLKVLHSFLEPARVAFVGISNWALDASKQNRGITLSKPEPDVEDLLQSANSISEEINKNFILDKLKEIKLIDKLVNGYDKYFKKQQKQNFHGLRDFYQMIAQINYKLFNQENVSNMNTLIVNAIERNFGGFDISHVIKSFSEAFPNNKSLKDFKATHSSKLIKENFLDLKARNLMIISEHLESSTLHFIEEELRSIQKTYEVFQGSDFEEDKNEQSAYKQINDIILCMERGDKCILLNLDSIYQSFYDMLNQNYTVQNGYKYCKVAIGPDSSRCMVHDEFKCILIVDQKKIKNMDAPLLNRFEKQIYRSFEDINEDQNEKDIRQQLTQWLKDISEVEDFKIQNMFPTLDSDESSYLYAMNSLVTLSKQIYSIENENHTQSRLQYCKSLLIQLATYSGIIRCKNSKAGDSTNLINIYKNVQNHNSLREYFKIALIHWRQDQRAQGKDELGTCNTIFTFHSSIADYQKELDYIKCEKLIYLQNIHSKLELQNKIQEYIDTTKNTNQLLIIVADSITDSIDRLSLVKSIINQSKIRAMKAQDQEFMNIEKHFILIVKIYGKYQANLCFQAGWSEAQIDILNGRGIADITLGQLINLDFISIIRNKVIFSTLIKDSLTETMSKIKYGLPEDKIRERIDRISLLLQPKDDFYDLLVDLFIQMLQKHENYELLVSGWQDEVVKDKQLMNLNMSFHSASIYFFKNLIAKHYSFIFYEMEKENLAYSLLEQNHKSQTVVLIFQTLMTQDIIPNTNLLAGYNLSIDLKKTNLPFSSLIYKQMHNLKHAYFQTMENTKAEIQNLLNINDMLTNDDGNNKVVEEYKDGLVQIDTHLINIRSREIIDDQAFHRDIEGNLNYVSKLIFDQIQSLMHQAQIIMPEIILKTHILNTNIDLQIEDFSFIIMGEEQDQNVHQFMILFLTRFDHLKSIPDIYATYWYYEEYIQKVFNAIKILKDCIDFDFLFISLDKSIQYVINHQKGQLPTIQLLFEELIKVIHDAFIPNEEVLLNLKNKGIKWADKAKVLIKDLYTMNTNQVNPFIKKFEFLIQYAEKVGTHNITHVFENIVEMSDPCLVIEQLFDMCTSDEDDDQQELLCEFIFSYIQNQLDSQLDQQIEQEMLENCITVYFKIYKNQKCFTDQIKTSFMRRIIQYACQNDQNIFIYQVIKDYKATINENLVLKYLDDTLYQCEEQEPLTSNTSVVLCDSIESAIQISTDYLDEEEIIEATLRHIEISLDLDLPMLQRLISLAFTRKMLKLQAQILLEKVLNSKLLKRIQDDEEEEKQDNIIRQGKFLNETLYALNQVFGQRFQEFQPLQIYLIKNLMTTLNLKDISRIIKYYLPWIRNLTLTDNAQMNSFKILANEDRIGALLQEIQDKSSFKNYVRQTKETAQGIRSQNFFLIHQAAMIHFYLNNQQDRLGISDEILTLHTNPFLQNHVKQMLTRNFNNKQQLLVLDHSYLKEILSFTSICVASSSAEAFITRIFIDPMCLQNIFVPFMPNVQEDLMYQEQFRNYGAFTRWRCANCNRIFCVLDCGDLHAEESHSKDQGMCEGCSQPIGAGPRGVQNSTRMDLKKNSGMLETFNEAIKNYLYQEPSHVHETVIRALTPIARTIGTVVLHSILLLSLLFQDDNMIAQISHIVAPNRNPRINPRDSTIEAVLGQITEAWQWLKSNTNLNDDNLQMIVQYVMYAMTMKSQDPSFQYDILGSIQGRQQFENLFLSLCVPQHHDQFTSFIQNQKVAKINNELVKHLEERIDKDQYEQQQEKYLFPLLRIQSQPSMIGYNHYITQKITRQTEFIKCILDARKSLENISLIEPILNWVIFVYKNLSGRIKFEDAMNFSTNVAINQYFTEPRDHLEALALFTHFSTAWNCLADQGIPMMEGCDQITIQKMGLNCIFLNSCITSTKNDSTGFILNIVLRYLLRKQNAILDKISSHEAFKECNSGKESFMRLKAHQIISTDLNIERIEELIKSSGFSNTEYGKGKEVIYCDDLIFDKLKLVFLSNKAYIDLDEQVDFQFQNIGNLNSQFNDIHDKVPQVLFTGRFEIIDQLKTIEDKSSLLFDIKTTMNFLEQNRGKQDFSLADYMNSFRIQRFTQHMSHQIKLKHVLHFYEELESSLHSELIDKTHPKYKQPLLPINQDLLIELLQANSDYIEVIKDALARFCIRQLQEQLYTEKDKLFQLLFDDMNTSLFGVGNDIDLGTLTLMFTESQISIGEAYETFRLIADMFRQRREEEQEAEKEAKKKIARNQAIIEAEVQEEGDQQTLISQVVKKNNPLYEEEHKEENILEEQKTRRDAKPKEELQQMQQMKQIKEDHNEYLPKKEEKKNLFKKITKSK